MGISTTLAAALLAVSSMALSTGTCRAQPAMVAEGHRLVQPCARCHVIDAGGASSWTDAPSFESIANRPGSTPSKLAAYIQQQHLHMLTDEYSKAQANSMAFYILSLRQK